MIRVRPVAPDVDQLRAAADRVATVLTILGGRRRPYPRRDGDGYSLYLDAELPADDVDQDGAP